MNDENNQFKRYKLEEKNESFDIDGSTKTIAIAGTSADDEPSPYIINLNMDCFQYLFEWLSFKELLVLRSSCKHMKKVVDYYIKMNYKSLSKLSIHEWQNLSERCDILKDCLEWIRHLHIWTNFKLTDTESERSKYVLNQLESLKMLYVDFDGDFHDVLLKYCPSLKYLGIATWKLTETIIGTENKWLFREYPTLEHFEIRISLLAGNTHQITELLIQFFKRNPSIRILSIESEFLSINYRQILESNLKFERLELRCFEYSNYKWLSDSLSELHKQQFYQQLHLINTKIEYFQNIPGSLLAFHNLEKLELAYPDRKDVLMPTVESIKELKIKGTILADHSYNLPKLMAMHFINLRRIEIESASFFHDIRPFVCYMPNLIQIRIQKLFRKFHDHKDVELGDFIALNDERKKLGSQTRKVIIFIGETNFLKMKWTVEINLSLIELRRFSTCEIDQTHQLRFQFEKVN